MDYIKKIDIEVVEARLGVDFRRNIISIGFDVAGHETGIAVIRTTDSYLILEIVHKFSIPNKVTEMDALDLFISQLDDFKLKMSQKYKFDENIIENCFFGKNVNTTKLLARCSGLVYDRFKGISNHSQLIMPTTARSNIRFKKDNPSSKGPQLKKEILNYINDVLETKIKDDDIGDGIVLALNGLLLTY